MIRQYSKRLKLTTLVDNMHDIPFESPEQYIGGLLAREVEEREKKRINRLIRAAGFPVIKTLDRFDWSNVALPKGVTVEDLTAGRFLDTKDNLVAVGPVGTGKTHLMIALGVECCRRGKKIKFFTAAKLVNQLLEEYRKGTLNRFSKTLTNLDALLIDELGYVPFHKDGSELLFDVISQCYEQRSLAITTNLEFGYWNSVFGDNRLTAALIDRVIHHAHFLVFSGESYRLRESLRRQQTSPSIDGGGLTS